METDSVRLPGIRRYQFVHPQTLFQWSEESTTICRGGHPDRKEVEITAEKTGKWKIVRSEVELKSFLE